MWVREGGTLPPVGNDSASLDPRGERVRRGQGSGPGPLPPLTPTTLPPGGSRGTRPSPTGDREGRPESPRLLSIYILHSVEILPRPWWGSTPRSASPKKDEGTHSGGWEPSHPVLKTGTTGPRQWDLVGVNLPTDGVLAHDTLVSSEI